jgi:SAM-dependent methyltransferase
MLNIARQRCPEARFSRQDMCDFTVSEAFDAISCFLYSIHYSGSIDKLKSCIQSVYTALKPDGMFCFNAVDKSKIDNNSFTRHSAKQDNSQFIFSSRWYYCGEGEQQSLKLSIHKTTEHSQQSWRDEHTMVAVSFAELQDILSPYFNIHIFEHDYDKLIPWNSKSGNALFVCVKI